MILEIIYASLTVQPENADRFKEILWRISDEAGKLPGCLKYDWFNRSDDENIFVIYAEFDTENRYLFYKKSNVLKLINGDLFPLLYGEPVFKHFRACMIESYNV